MIKKMIGFISILIASFFAFVVMVVVFAFKGETNKTSSKY